MSQVKSKGKSKSPVSKSGLVITDDVAERLADEAERGYDLSEFTVRAVGRPSLGQRGTSPRFSFRASPETFRAARLQADREGVSLSELAREAIRQYVEA